MKKNLTLNIAIIIGAGLPALFLLTFFYIIMVYLVDKPVFIPQNIYGLILIFFVILIPYQVIKALKKINNKKLDNFFNFILSVVGPSIIIKYYNPSFPMEYFILLLIIFFIINFFLFIKWKTSFFDAFVDFLKKI